MTTRCAESVALLLVASATVLAACVPLPASAPPSSPVRPPEATVTKPAPLTPTVPAAGPRVPAHVTEPPEAREQLPLSPEELRKAAAVDQAMKALAETIGVATNAITVKLVEAVQWRDASLDCPQPGMMYAQVITPGHRVVLEADGKTYAVHTADAYAIVCQR